MCKLLLVVRTVHLITTPRISLTLDNVKEESMWVPSLPVAIATGLCAGAGVICLFKDMYGGPAYEHKISAEGKTVIVTGATSGIGKETAWGLAKRGAKVFMACQDMEKCEAVRRNIVLETSNKYVYCRPCDLASTASIRDFVARFKSEEPYVHALVNNAGVMETPQGVTRDGFETQLGVNHLGHFLLTNLLLDTLKASGASRVVVVTCDTYSKGCIQQQDLNMSSKYDARTAYCQSKLANVLFAQELGRRLLDTDVAVLTVDPGFTDTHLSRHLPMMKSVTRFFIYPIFWPFMKSARTGSQTLLHAVLEPSLQSSKGDLYVDMKKAEISGQGKNFEMAQWLWKVSEKWTNLGENRSALAKAAAA